MKKITLEQLGPLADRHEIVVEMRRPWDEGQPDQTEQVRVKIYPDERPLWWQDVCGMDLSGAVVERIEAPGSWELTICLAQDEEQYRRMRQAVVLQEVYGWVSKLLIKQEDKQ